MSKSIQLKQVSFQIFPKLSSNQWKFCSQNFAYQPKSPSPPEWPEHVLGIFIDVPTLHFPFAGAEISPKWSDPAAATCVKWPFQQQWRRKSQTISLQRTPLGPQPIEGAMQFPAGHCHQRYWAPQMPPVMGLSHSPQERMLSVNRHHCQDVFTLLRLHFLFPQFQLVPNYLPLDHPRVGVTAWPASAPLCQRPFTQNSLQMQSRAIWLQLSDRSLELVPLPSNSVLCLGPATS